MNKEKELIEHYLSIQLLKHEDSRNVDFYHAGIRDNNKIAPMILINFIENCFKHSDLETNPRGWIKIGLEVEKNELSFRTENTFKEEVKEVALSMMKILPERSFRIMLVKSLSWSWWLPVVLHCKRSTILKMIV